MAGILPCLAAAQTFPSGNSSEVTGPESPLDVLRDFNSPPNARNAAALQLLGTRDAAAKSAVLELLQSGPDGSKLALARALAAIPWPDPDFQQPLMGLFGVRDPAAGAAAATALAQYRDDPGVMQTLIDQAQTGRPEVRIPAIRALGSFARSKAAQTLLELLERDNTRNNSDAIREAAGDALIEMTGRSDLDHNAQEWQKWYDSVKTLSDQQFSDAIIRSRGADYEKELGQHDVFEKATHDLLRDAFLDAPPEKRAGILMGYLRSPAAEIRAIGADLVFQSANEGNAPPGTIQQTRQLLTDPSPRVRAAAATALTADVDPSALVDQLRREPDDMVRVRILRSLARFRDQAAIELMLDLVGPGESGSVRAAAADGIRDGSTVINADPALKAKAIDRLKAALEGTDPPDKQRLREAITGALSQISDQKLSEVFLPLLLPAETWTVRANALIGLGNLPNPAPYGPQISRNLEDLSSETLRLAAVQAFRRLPSQAYIATMLSHMTSDPSDQVRAAAWNVLQDWARAPDADEANLTTIAEGLKSDPAKELVIRQLLCNRLDADAHNSALSDDRRKEAAQQHAVQEQNVGDLAMDPAVNQPPLAADAYKSALEYWKANNGQLDVISRLSAQLTQAYLSARRWEDATNFASQVVKDYRSNASLGPILQQVVQEFLVKAADFKVKASTDPAAFEDAMHMFDAVEKMNPPLPGSYPAQLEQKQKDMQQEHAGASRPGV
jgi:HEAT repeat protein